ncbi:hypothetical protein [Paraburkholderia mimosarum]|uniref:hypothetical protein n=1 Tax=Paraburkholderia mimosarum TaxID=312026 RepID=UPI0012B65242|nr:hypothetical protein [Paraburkholderia mimosarum]
MSDLYKNTVVAFLAVRRHNVLSFANVNGNAGTTDYSTLHLSVLVKTRVGISSLCHQPWRTIDHR